MTTRKPLSINKRREFSRAVKSAILVRAMNGTNTVFCEGCGMDLTGKEFEFDHTIPEALVIDKSKELTAADGKLLGACCHRGEDGKTNKDIARIAKARRQEAMRFSRPKGNIKSPGFPPRQKQAGAASSPIRKWTGMSRPNWSNADE